MLLCELLRRAKIFYRADGDENIEISGIQVPCLTIELDYAGTRIYEKVIVKQIGSWMGTITLASVSETEIEELVGRISFE